MKIVVYTADSEVPFKEFKKPLIGWNKILFSNKKEIRFNENAVRALLPKGIRDSNDASIRYIPDEDDSIFFVPLEMKDMFIEQLKRLFKTTEWRNSEPQKPSKEELGLGGSGDELAQFYDKIVVDEILVPKRTTFKECSNKALEKLLNEIIQEDNLINAVFVYYFDSAMLCKSAEDSEIGKSLIDGIDSISFDTLKKVYHTLVHFGEMAKRGDFMYGTFRFGDGIFNLYFSNKIEQLVIIGFFSTTGSRLQLLPDCEQAVERIEKAL